MPLFVRKQISWDANNVIQVTGTVRERSSKNPNIPTGEIEIIVSGTECPECCRDSSFHD